MCDQGPLRTEKKKKERKKEKKNYAGSMTLPTSIEEKQTCLALADGI